MKNKVPMPKEEMMRSIFRPRESTRKKTKMEVATSLTMPYIPDARSELVVPEYPIYKTQAHIRKKKSVSATTELWGGVSMTYRLEDLRRIVIDRVLSTPLLEQEYHHSNHKSNELSLAQERLPEAQPPPRRPLLHNSSLDLCHLHPDSIVIRRQAAEVSQVRNGVFGAPLGR